MKTKASSVHKRSKLSIPEEVQTLIRHLNSAYFAETNLPWSFPDNTDPVGDRLWLRGHVGGESNGARHKIVTRNIRYEELPFEEARREEEAVMSKQQSERIAHQLAADQAPVLPVDSIPEILTGWCTAEGLEWLKDNGRLADLWCCPMCRHFFLADHGRQRFCSDSCRQAARPVSKRDRAAYMRRHRKLLRERRQARVTTRKSASKSK